MKVYIIIEYEEGVLGDLSFIKYVYSNREEAENLLDSNPFLTSVGSGKNKYWKVVERPDIIDRKEYIIEEHEVL